MAKHKSLGARLAAKYEAARDAQRERFEDLELQARDPYEYGKLTDQQLLAQVIDEDKALAKVIDKAARYDGLCH